jgi:ferredoxin
MAEPPALPALDAAKCTGCGDCVAVCPPGVLGFVGERPQLVRPERCDYCSRCEAVCAEEAISCPYDIVLDSNG